MRAIRSVAKLPVDPLQVLKNPKLLGEVVELVESHPDHVLFHLPEELSDQGSTHPNVSRRMLYLWRNREAIADAGTRP